LCLSEQENISILSRHLTSYHKISHEADAILFLQGFSQEQRQNIVKGLIKTEPAVAVGDLEKQESLIQNTPPASPREEMALTVEELIATSTLSKTEPKVTEENTKMELPETIYAKKEEAPLTVSAGKPELPKRPVLRSRTRAVAGEEVKTRKRKSLMMCENAVSNRIQFWKTRETVEKDGDDLGHGKLSMVSSLQQERKTENLVNKLLVQQTIKKTEVDESSPQLDSSTPIKVVATSYRSADDTISMFDELFTAVCPDTINIDDHIETNFNLIYEEEEKQERRMSEDSIGEKGGFETSETNIESLCEENHEMKERSCVGHEEEELTPLREMSYVNSIVESIEKVSRPSESKVRTSISSPNNSSDVDKSTLLGNSSEKVEGKYKCDDCGKDFKFLTYLKGHKSKSGCINSNGKKKRPSMNFSKIIY